MAYTRVYIHFVFGTKRRYPFLDGFRRKKLLDHICENAKQKNIHVHSVNGYDDHIHLLVRLEPSQDIAGIARMIKGESASWANKTSLFEKAFAWATGYYAASVDGEDRPRIDSYIQSQDARHYTPVKQFLESATNG